MTVELYQQDRLGPALDLDRIMGFPIVRPKFQIPEKQACEVSIADGERQMKAYRSGGNLAPYGRIGLGGRMRPLPLADW